VPAPGEVRGALLFKGTNYVQVQDSPLWNFGANNFTIELWANWATPPGGSVGEPAAILIGNDEGPGNRNKWFFAVGGGYLYFHINSPTLGPQFFPLVPFSPVVGQWYHLAVVRTGSTYTVFINGVASGTATNANVIADPNAPLTIGEGEDIGFMNGLLDEVTVYNRGLEPEEIRAIYNAGSGGKCISLQVSPNAGGDTGNVSVQINSVGFEQGATVSLVMTGQPSIPGNPIAVGANGTTIATTFNLTGATQGAWDVVVTNPDGTSQTLPQGFTIQAGTEPQIWVDIVGIDLIVPGRAQPFQIFYGNTGNVDAVGVPLGIAGIPPDGTLSLGFNVLPPLPLADPSEDFSQVPTSINTGTQIVGAFLIPVIPAGSTGALQISITIPELEDFQLQAWTNSPWFGSQQQMQSLRLMSSSKALRRSMSWRARLDMPLDLGTGDLLGCALGVLDALYFNKNPNTECVQDEFQAYEGLLTNEADLKTEGKLNAPDVVSEFWALVHGAYQCAYAAACDVCETAVADEVIPESCVVCEAPRLAKDFNAAYSFVTADQSCAKVAYQTAKAVATMHAIQSKDPNSKSGPNGVGPAQWVSGQQPLTYDVSFENLPAATAPAQQVAVTDQLDASNVDLSTLSLGPIAFGSNQLIPPAGSSTFAATVDLRPAVDLLVEVTGSLDPNTELLTWKFISIDPATGNPPTNPAIGFLPPDINPPQGEGSVLFTVMPKQGDATGTQITNQATIVFDANPPISTPTWLNTLDVTPPVSKVGPLPATEKGTAFKVKWSGTDQGSGIQNYTIYASDNGGPFTAFLINTSATSTSFTGQAGHTYGFYSISRDLVGNVENPKTSPEATTQATKGGPPSLTITPASLAFGSVAVGSTSGSKTIKLTLKGPTLSALAISSIAPSGDYSETDNCPTNLGAGTNCTITVAFAPNVVGALNGALSIYDSFPNSPQVVALTGTGLALVSAAPASISLSSPVGSTSNPATATVTNNTAAAVSLSYSASATFSAAPGSPNGCGSTVPANGNCKVAVTFTPEQPGTINGSLVVTGAFPTQVVNLTGIATGGTAPALTFSPAKLMFKTPQAIGTTSSPLTVIMTNKGTAAVAISGLSASHGFMATPSGTTPCSGSLAAKANCTFQGTFTPQVIGATSGSISVANSGAINPLLYDMSGTGINAISFSPASLTFAAQAVGTTSAPKTVTLSNNQSVTANIASIVASGDYSTVPGGASPCGSAVPANSSCTLIVTFNPTKTGTIRGVVTATDDAPTSAQVLPLTGKGQ